MIIRPTNVKDVPELLNMLRLSGQFDEDGLNHVNDTLETYLSGESQEIWLTAELEGLAGVAYCAPEVMADGTWNLLMLWVNPDFQRRGIGQSLVEQVELSLKSRQARLLIVETSGTDDFVLARNFYDKAGFTQEARIRNFYAPQDDKVIYTKPLL